MIADAKHNDNDLRSEPRREIESQNNDFYVSYVGSGTGIMYLILLAGARGAQANVAVHKRGPSNLKCPLTLLDMPLACP